MKIGTKIQADGTVLVAIEHMGLRMAKCTVRFRPDVAQGDPRRYDGLPRWPEEIREPAKIAIRKALAS